ncbi:hypothetical protein XA68_13368 [Ophiocordyceps unilateralis]|uniref:Small secreted protein n=1 Tax=Ophiocordyceps unilateralis TaxID=268505 RepID=A0A2A9PNT5_OPHUN|nr:hypothetical protein XA68_13368 [Ophiocordyceps unilateralis]
MFTSSVWLGCLLAGQGLAISISNLNLTALAASDGKSTLECWQVGPFESSTRAGTSGTPSFFFGDVVNATYAVIPPKFDGGLHNAPAFQFVFFASGSALITLPNGTDKAMVEGGKNGLIIAADTADVSRHGHRTQYLSDENTVSLQVPIRNPEDFEHKVLHDGACTKAETSGI